jgi:hypothetical protein
LNRPGDITLADFWGYRKRKYRFRNDDKGISLVLINTDNGGEMFDKLKANIVFTEVSLDEVVSGNQALRAPFPAAKNRREFWDAFRKRGFAGVIAEYLYPEKIDIVTRILYIFGRNSLPYFLARNTARGLRLVKRILFSLSWNTTNKTITLPPVRRE